MITTENKTQSINLKCEECGYILTTKPLTKIQKRVLQCPGCSAIGKWAYTAAGRKVITK